MFKDLILTEPNCWFLMDAAQVPTFFSHSVALPNTTYINLFANTPEADIEPQYSPILIPYSKDDDFLAKILPRQHAYNWLSVLQTRPEYPFNQFIENLQSFLSAKLPDGSEVLVRWYDPRILHLMPIMLAPIQLEKFVEGIEHWYYQQEDQLLDLKQIIAAK